MTAEIIAIGSELLTPFRQDTNSLFLTAQLNSLGVEVGFKTIVGDIKYGPNGEWEEARVLQVQFHDVKGSDLEQWKSDATQTIVWPAKYATGKTAYPYADAKK